MTEHTEKTADLELDHRQTVLSNIAWAAARGVDARADYRDEIHWYKISDAEIEAEVKRANPGIKNAHISSDVEARPHAEEVIIPLWPLPFATELITQSKALDYGTPCFVSPGTWRESQQVRKPAKTQKVGPAEIFQWFVLIWILGWLFAMGGLVHGGWGVFNLVNYIALGFVGLLAKQKGITHVAIGKESIDLLCMVSSSQLKKDSFPLSRVSRVYVLPSKSKNVLDAELIIEGQLQENSNFPTFRRMFSMSTSERLSRVKAQRIKLRRFNGPERWREFVKAIRVAVADERLSGAQPIVELDESLLDGLAQQNNPSFTRMWLDALAAPPRRQRLQPLTAGMMLQNGRFKIESQLGSGGQGNAYVASCAEHGTVVLKEFILPLYVDVEVRKQAITRFQAESAILSKLSHDGIIRLYDAFIEDQRGYLVLERARGSSLKSLVETSGPVSEAKAIELGIEMCGILQYLHCQSPPLVHRDFTPDNIIETQKGLKLIDFGGANDVSNKQHTVVGKRNYMPPEQFRGKPTPQSDIFALGCTLAYLVTGVDPEPISQSHPRRLNTGLSAEFNEIVEHATHVDCNKRFQSAAELQARLQALHSLVRH